MAYSVWLSAICYLLWSERSERAIRHKLNRELSVFKDRLPVDDDRALGAQILDDIPVNRGPVRAAALRVGTAQCDVDRAADLLVEQNVFREPVDVRVRPKRELAE